MRVLRLAEKVTGPRVEGPPQIKELKIAATEHTRTITQSRNVGLEPSRNPEKYNCTKAALGTAAAGTGLGTPLAAETAAGFRKHLAGHGV